LRRKSSCCPYNTGFFFIRWWTSCFSSGCTTCHRPQQLTVPVQSRYRPR